MGGMAETAGMKEAETRGLRALLLSDVYSRKKIRR
jgi:hypothetical protein